MPVDDGTCIGVTLPQLGVALDHGVDPMTVLDREPSARKIQYGAIRQGCKLAPLLFRPFRGYIVVADDSDDGTLRLLQLPKHSRATDIAGMHNVVAVLRKQQYPVVNVTVGVGEQTDLQHFDRYGFDTFEYISATRQGFQPINGKPF